MEKCTSSESVLLAVLAGILGCLLALSMFLWQATPTSFSPSVTTPLSTDAPR
jgi:hypothetical protein